MSDLQSRVYQPSPNKCCERCVFGRGEHAEFCRLASRGPWKSKCRAFDCRQHAMNGWPHCLDHWDYTLERLAHDAAETQ